MGGLPHTIVHFNANKQASFYRYRAGLDGRINIKTIPHYKASRSPKRAIVTLDPALVFHREVSFLPQEKHDIEILGAGMFPFQPHTTTYAANNNDSPRICALPKEDLRHIEVSLERLNLNVEACLVAPENKIRLALEDRLTLGKTADLADGTPTFYHPAIARFVLWGAMAAVLLYFAGEHIGIFSG